MKQLRLILCPFHCTSGMISVNVTRHRSTTTSEMVMTFYVISFLFLCRRALLTNFSIVFQAEKKSTVVIFMKFSRYQIAFRDYYRIIYEDGGLSYSNIISIDDFHPFLYKITTRMYVKIYLNTKKTHFDYQPPKIKFSLWSKWLRSE